MANIIGIEDSNSRPNLRINPVPRHTAPHLAKEALIRAACQFQLPTCVCHRGIIPPSGAAARLNPVTTGSFDFHIPTVDNFLLMTGDVSLLLPPAIPLELCVTNISYTQFLFVSDHVDALVASSAGFAKHARLKYDGPTGTLVISAPSLAHDIVSQLPAEILRAMQSNNLDFYGDWKADGARQVVNSGSKIINLNSGPLRASRAPDGSLKLADALVPFLVVEVVDSNMTRKGLQGLAIKYAIGSDTNVRVIILIKLHHKPPRRLKRKRGRSGFHPPSGAANDPIPVIDNEFYTHGSLWVYTYTVVPLSGTSEVDVDMQCVAENLEFYPTPPLSHLTLTWREMMNPKLVPAHVADKSVNIPYTIFTQLLVTAQREKEANLMALTEDNVDEN